VAGTVVVAVVDVKVVEQDAVVAAVEVALEDEVEDELAELLLDVLVVDDEEVEL